MLPAGTLFAAFWIVRHGCAFVPAAASLPAAATKKVRLASAEATAGRSKVAAATAAHT